MKKLSGVGAPPFRGTHPVLCSGASDWPQASFRLAGCRVRTIRCLTTSVLGGRARRRGKSAACSWPTGLFHTRSAKILEAMREVHDAIRNGKTDH